jgi:hypothetical protein
MTDDTPTQRIPEAEDATGDLVEERKKSKALLFTLVGVGAALLIAIIVLLIILFGGNASGDPQADPTTSESPSESPTPSDSPTPTESATPSATPTPTPTPTTAPPPPPPDTSPGFASFNLQTGTVTCQSPPAGDPGDAPVLPPSPQMRFTWSAKNAQSVWFIFGTDDAASAGAFQVPLNGDQDDVYGSSGSMPFPCPQTEQKMTLTVVGNNGQHVNKTFTVKNNGYTG